MDSSDSEWLRRMSSVTSKESMLRIQKSNVLVVGLGGVGGLAAELTARLGVGSMTIVDGDVIETTNRNRQILALHSTIGKRKTEVMEERLSDINPSLNLKVVDRFLFPEDMPLLLENECFDCALDAIDSVPSKIALLAECVRHGIPAVSAMGAGLRMDPGAVCCKEIAETSVCPLAKKVRKGLRLLGIESGIKAVYSTELPIRTATETSGKMMLGSVSFLPAVFAAHCVSAVYRILSEIK